VQDGAASDGTASLLPVPVLDSRMATHSLFPDAIVKQQTLIKNYHFGRKSERIRCSGDTEVRIRDSSGTRQFA
jgi:hypothetical protein